MWTQREEETDTGCGGGVSPDDLMTTSRGTQRKHSGGDTLVQIFLLVALGGGAEIHLRRRSTLFWGGDTLVQILLRVCAALGLECRFVSVARETF